MAAVEYEARVAWTFSNGESLQKSFTISFVEPEPIEVVIEEIVEAVEAEQQSISYTRKKPVRKPLPKDLPREQVIHDIEDKTCDCCGGEQIGCVESRRRTARWSPR